MAEQIVSSLWEMLISSTIEEIQQEIKLVAGVDNGAERLRRHLQYIQAVLRDAEDKPVKESAVKLWLDQLKFISYDVEDVLDRWDTAMMKLRIEGGIENAAPVPQKKVSFFFPCHCFGVKEVALRHNIAQKIKEVNERLNEIAREKDMYNLNLTRTVDQTIERMHTTSLIDESEIYGRDVEKSILLNRLVCESSDRNSRPYVISIVGMGGIGKTILAQVAYNTIKNNFDIAIWVCVSNPFDQFRIAKAIINGLGVPTPNSEELDTFMRCICASITNKKIFLVFDDVWTENYEKWKPFELCLNSSAHESRILITTRKENVAHMMKSHDIITIKELSEEYCWLLFTDIAFFARTERECQNLEDIGRKIVHKCKGLPLAAKTIASLLRSKRTRGEWRQILNSEIWKLENLEKDIFEPLLLSYNDLPFTVKQCFLYCSIFPKGFRINKDDLIKLWMAQGYLGFDPNKELENIGEEFFNHLASRSFFQEFGKDEDGNIISCKMHDIVHDFAQFLSKDEYFTKNLYNDTEPLTDSLQQETVHHSMVTVSRSKYLNLTFSFRKLRSLLICFQLNLLTVVTVPQQLFDKLTCLRALHMGRYLLHGSWEVKNIPTGIEKLIHLRYLNLSQHSFKKLPESLCELFNLQTLDIYNCYALEELPQGMRKLINLRHLLNNKTHSLRYLPKGIERLTCLRTLSDFVVGSSAHDSQACSLRSLNNLNHLSGKFTIRRLGNLLDVGETKVFVLDNNENILSLDLDFTTDADCLEGLGAAIHTDKKDETLLEALKPHPSLEELKIEYYRGSTICPSWMISLSNLRKLTVKWCQNCKHLFPLGKLQSLESLQFNGWIGGSRVGNEFWGIESECYGTSSSLNFFPRLKYLSICGTQWEEWNYEIARDRETNIMIMPDLVSLTITHSYKLKALPDILLQSTTLKKLYIHKCTLLQELYKKETGYDWPKISHIPNVIING